MGRPSSRCRHVRLCLHRWLSAWGHPLTTAVSSLLPPGALAACRPILMQARMMRWGACLLLACLLAASLAQAQEPAATATADAPAPADKAAATPDAAPATPADAAPATPADEPAAEGAPTTPAAPAETPAETPAAEVAAPAKKPKPAPKTVQPVVFAPAANVTNDDDIDPEGALHPRPFPACSSAAASGAPSTQSKHAPAVGLASTGGGGRRQPLLLGTTSNVRTKPNGLLPTPLPTPSPLARAHAHAARPHRQVCQGD